MAAGCALAVWLLGLLAVSPQMHAAMHPAAGHPNHVCAVTLFSHGAEDSLGAVQTTVTPVLFVAGEPAASLFAPAARAHVRLPPGCGPPSS